eukprot:SAG31_NODE_796_length_12032_cov_21.073242_13_plen_82_part_00
MREAFGAHKTYIASPLCYWALDDVSNDLLPLPTGEEGGTALSLWNWKSVRPYRATILLSLRKGYSHVQVANGNVQVRFACA